MKAKTAIQKRDQAPAPRVEVLTEAKGTQYPPGRLLIASPRAIADVVARIPRGQVLRLSDLRQHLAGQFHADYTCPMTTGIFLRVAAEAAVEAQEPLPYWRVVRDDGRLLDKLPGGPAEQQQRLQAEGLSATTRRGTCRVDLNDTTWQP